MESRGMPGEETSRGAMVQTEIAELWGTDASYNDEIDEERNMQESTR
jgi:hypothetical protein